MKRSTYLIGPAIAFIAACAATEAPNNGGRTNWLMDCDRDAECGELACLEDVCTRSCDRSSDCEDLGSGAICEEQRCVDAPNTDSEPTPVNQTIEAGANPEFDVREAGVEPEPTSTPDTNPVGPIEAGPPNPVDGPTPRCLGPDTPAGAYECREVLVPCPCDDPGATRCVAEGERFIAFRCDQGEWQPTSNSSCVPDSADCFSPTLNLEVARSGNLRGCSCTEDEEFPLETCAQGDDIQVPMWCSNGTWEAEASDCGLTWDLCAFIEPDPFIDGGACPEVISSVSQRSPELGTDFGPVLGEPGCERGCGYRYYPELEDSPDYSGWAYAPEIECPLDTGECLALSEALHETALECESDDDCTLLDGVTNCDNVFEPPLYLDSSRLSDDARAERAGIWEQILAKGCGNTTGFDGPAYDVGCISGFCDLRTVYYCGDGSNIGEDAGSGGLDLWS